MNTYCTSNCCVWGTWSRASTSSGRVIWNSYEHIVSIRAVTTCLLFSNFYLDNRSIVVRKVNDVL